MTRFSLSATVRYAFVCAAVVAGLAACDRDNGTNPKSSIPSQIQAMQWPDSMIAGQAVTFHAMVLDQHGDTVSGPQLHWTNSAPSVLSIETLANGDSIRVTALRPGSALVTADVVGANDSVHVSGTVNVMLAGATITTPAGGSNLPLLGSQVVLSARGLGFGDASLDSTGLTWSAGLDSVVTVTPFAGGDSATVTASRYGTDTVTVTAPSCHGQCSTQIVLSVGHAVAAVAVTPSIDTLKTVGAQVQMSAAAYHADSTTADGVPFTWASSDTTVATVDSTGLVTAVASGTAYIMAYGENVQSNAAAITVSLLGGPNAGGDVVVFNDADMFQNSAFRADSGNDILVKNLVSYTASGTNASGTAVWIDFGHNSVCIFACSSVDSTAAVIERAGYTVSFKSTRQGSLTSIPSSVKVIMLVTPAQSFTTNEVNALKTFASNGGRIVFIGEGQTLYRNSFTVENTLLGNLGSGLSNTGGTSSCSTDLPGSSIRATQVTVGVPSLSVSCAGAMSGGSDDFLFLYDSTNVTALAGVSHVNTSPITPTGVIEHPRLVANK